MAFGLEEVIHTPQCFVQMELTQDLERGIKRIEMCSSVKLKVVQHDIQIMCWGESKAIIKLSMTLNTLIIKQKQFY